MSDLNEKKILLKVFADQAQFYGNTAMDQSGAIVFEVNDSEDDAVCIAAYGANSNKKIGDKATPFIKKVIRSLSESGDSGMTHIDAKDGTSDGRVKLNIFAIRNSDGKLIGLNIRCTEIDIFYTLRDTINSYLGYTCEESQAAASPENQNSKDSRSLSLYMQQIIEEEIRNTGITADRMTIDEKRDLVQRLESLEVFCMRDSVKITANLLGVSVPTVYRLLKKDNKG